MSVDNICFILTALGETQLIHEVRIWRDNQGNWFNPIEMFYYTLSPYVAEPLSKSQKVKELIRNPLKTTLRVLIGSSNQKVIK